MPCYDPRDSRHAIEIEYQDLTRAFCFIINKISHDELKKLLAESYDFRTAYIRHQGIDRSCGRPWVEVTHEDGKNIVLTQHPGK